jgi:SSS family solute:Na+ symporter
MDYLQTLFGFFNAPLFATFILGMFWKRMTPTAAWVGLVAGTLAAVAVWLGNEVGVYELPGQGAAFLAASMAFLVDFVLSVAVSLVTKPKPASELRGLVYSETPREDLIDPHEAGRPWFQRTLPLAAVALAMVIALNFAF